jgi:hypothetical protein
LAQDFAATTYLALQLYRRIHASNVRWPEVKTRMLSQEEQVGAKDAQMGCKNLYRSCFRFYYDIKLYYISIYE